MRRPAMNILLLAIFCLWCHLQPAAGAICTGPNMHVCAGGSRKRTGIDGLAKATDLGSDGERPDRQEARVGERRGDGGRKSDEYRDSREGDDLRSESSDRRQLSEKRANTGNLGHLPRSVAIDFELGRLRSLLRTLDVDDREKKKEEKEEEKKEEKEEENKEEKKEEEKEEKKEKKEEKKEEKQEQRQEEEPGRRSSTDTDKRYIDKDTLTMLRRILDDVERRLDSQPVSDSVNKKRGRAEDADDN